MKRFILIFLTLLVLCPHAEARRRWIPRTTIAGGTPTVSSASIAAANTGVTSLVLGFDQSCSIGAGGSGGMTISPSGGAATLGTPTGFPSATGTWAVTDRYILSSETVTRSYTQPGNGIEATTGGIDLATFTTQAVTNNSNVVAYDLFTRANAGTLGANWTDIVPGWGIVSNQASATALAATVTSYSATTPTSNQRVSVTLRTTPTGSNQFSILLRWDGTVGYDVLIDGSTATINEWVAGVPGAIASNSTTFVSGDILGFEANGSSLVVYKNGTSVLSTTDPTATTTQPVLVAMVPTGSQTFAFDNFVLQNLP